MGNLLKSTGFADAFRTPAVANRSIRFILFAIIINIIIIIVGCSRSTTAQLSRLGEGLFGSRQKNRLFVSFLLLLLLFFFGRLWRRSRSSFVFLFCFFFFRSGRVTANLSRPRLRSTIADDSAEHQDVIDSVDLRCRSFHENEKITILVDILYCFVCLFCLFVCFFSVGVRGAAPRPLFGRLVRFLFGFFFMLLLFSMDVYKWAPRNTAPFSDVSAPLEIPSFCGATKYSDGAEFRPVATGRRRAR